MSTRGTVLSQSFDADENRPGKDKKVFDALEWLANLCSHIPNGGKQMVRCCGFRNTVRRYSSIGNK